MSGRKSKGFSHYTIHNKVELIHSGAEYFALLEALIDKAAHSIHLQTYIYNDDETGTKIGDALIRAAKRNVQVYFIADGYASRRLSGTFIQKLDVAGIYFRFFQPLLMSDHFYFGRRMHVKTVVVDARYALVGGINISNSYNTTVDEATWFDLAWYVEGEVCINLFNICNKLWGKQVGLPADISSFMKGFETKELSVRVRENDWVKGKHQIWKTYFDLFNLAKKSITIMCSYFLPGRVFRRRLKMAAKRGVKVRVIMAGPSDVTLAKYAERYLYSWMWKNGIEVYEYQPSVLHSKVAVIDERWITIGSYNINNISAYASIELNLDVRNRLLGAQVQKELNEIIDLHCKKIEPVNSDISFLFLKRFLQKISYSMIKLILNLFTFYFKHEE